MTDNEPTNQNDSLINYPRLKATSVSLALTLMLAVQPVFAQSGKNNLGKIFCDTGIESAIDLAFTAVAGIGLPATMIYMALVGFKYLRASGQEQKKKAKESLTNALIGFAILTVAIISPEIIDKVGTQVGFGFSDCVKPF